MRHAELTPADAMSYEQLALERALAALSAKDAEIERLKRLSANSHKFWTRAGRAALNGDLRELRIRVDMAEAEPVELILSKQGE